MYYEEYLMCRLAHDLDLLNLFDFQGYDDEFKRGQELFAEFKASEYNFDSKPLYECIAAFIENKLLQIGNK